MIHAVRCNPDRNPALLTINTSYQTSKNHDNSPPSSCRFIILFHVSTLVSSNPLLSHLRWFFKNIASAFAPNSLAFTNANSGPPEVDVCAPMRCVMGMEVVVPKRGGWVARVSAWNGSGLGDFFVARGFLVGCEECSAPSESVAFFGAGLVRFRLVSLFVSAGSASTVVSTLVSASAAGTALTAFFLDPLGGMADAARYRMRGARA